MRSTWVVFSVLVMALALPAAVTMAQQPPLDPAQIEWELRVAPQVNALNLSAAQIQQLLPLLRESVAERDAEQAAANQAAQAELQKLREKLLAGTAQPDALKAIRQRLHDLTVQKTITPKRRELVEKIVAVLTPEQLAGFSSQAKGVKPKADGRPRVASQEADPAAVLRKLRALPAETYNQRRQQIAGAIVAQKLDPGSPEFTDAQVKLVAKLDAMRALASADFEAQKQKLAEDLTKEYGSLSPQMNEAFRKRMGERAAKAQSPVTWLEKIRAMPEEQYAQSKDRMADLILRDRKADPALRDKLLAKLNEVREMKPWDFDKQKQAIADSLTQEYGPLTPTPRAAAPKVAKEPALSWQDQRAARFLADPRAITFLEAKLKLMAGG